MSELSILPAWRAHNEKYEAAAIAFWQLLKELPPGEDGLARAKQLASVAYDGDRLAGVATAIIDRYPPLQVNLSFYRVLLEPENRGQEIMVPLVMEAFHAIEAWAKENPQAGLAGFGSVRQSDHLTANFKSPYARTTGAVLVGYTPLGDQVRVRWFDHYRPPAGIPGRQRNV